MHCRALCAGLVIVGMVAFEASAGMLETADGFIYLPEKPAKDNPVLVVAEGPRRAKQVLEMMKDQLDKAGVIAIAPKIPMKGQQADVAQAMPLVKNLVKHLLDEKKIKAGKKFAFGFSASGGLGATLGLHNSAEFAGLILAGTALTAPGEVSRCANKAFPVVVVAGEKDDTFPPAMVEGMKNTLVKDGLTNVRMLTIPGAGHMDLVGAKAGEYLGWVAGTVAELGGKAGK